jgi:hypothetical protein
MLYRLDKARGKFSSLEPQEFLDYSSLAQVEKDLEILLADHLLDVLFEEAPLMPIFQERQLQAEADLYALNRTGDLVIFELKRGFAGEDAMLQALRYAQAAGRWTFAELERRYQTYMKPKKAKDRSLAEAHREAFYLDRVLMPSEFNRRQHIIVVGNAANESLINAVDYWKQQGLSADFLPYRVYKIGDQHFFEFFSLPYDRHQNPAESKGVLFDTNRSYDEEAIWEMMEKGRVAAYGDKKHLVEYLNPKDIVFFSHKWTGLVAAGVVGPVRRDGLEQQYRDVRFLTPIPKRGDQPKHMPFSDVTKATGKSFFWAKTIKVPYLTREESRALVTELSKALA